MKTLHAWLRGVIVATVVVVVLARQLPPSPRTEWIELVAALITLWAFIDPFSQDPPRWVLRLIYLLTPGRCGCCGAEKISWGAMAPCDLCPVCEPLVPGYPGLRRSPE